MMALIWDLFDGVSTVQTPDQNPSDDGVSLGLGEIWRVLNGPMREYSSGFVTIYPFVYHLMAPYKGSTPASPTWTAIEKLLNHWKVEVPDDRLGRTSTSMCRWAAPRSHIPVWPSAVGIEGTEERGPARHQGRLRETDVGGRPRHARTAGRATTRPTTGSSSASPSARSTKANTVWWSPGPLPTSRSACTSTRVATARRVRITT